MERSHLRGGIAQRHEVGDGLTVLLHLAKGFHLQLGG